MTLWAHKNHPLAAHLAAVARRAEEFATHFDGAEQARLAGLLHDLGKAEQQFQARVLSDDKKGVKEPHAHHGAALVLGEESRGAPIWPVAFAINGHHAGLHNRPDVDKRRAFLRQAGRAEQWLTNDPEWKDQTWPLQKFAEKGAYLPEWLRKLTFDARQTSEGWRAVDLYTRFLFSALIDADRLDTEDNDPESKQAAHARKDWVKFSPEILLTKLNEHIARKRKDAEDHKASKIVLTVRQEVAAACVAAGQENERIRTLTVPTGGGKTLSSMLYALSYAKHHPGIRRVIVVIPYLSIIQQTALDLKAAFGDIRWDENLQKWGETEHHSVLEHHSQADDPEIKTAGKNNDDDGWSPELTRRRLAAENWDAPIVVTTSVQFFDSLFSRSPGDARKLHNIAQSVIIFDEVQTLPPRLMQPIIDVLSELTSPARPYGCSIVLCTATQPALHYHETDMPLGLKSAKEINGNAQDHFNLLNRVAYIGLAKDNEPPEMSWSMVADDLLKGKQGLVVVNTRKAARDLFKEVQQKKCDKQAVFHLSTWMFPDHRTSVLDEVRQRLDEDKPCYLISTQCIEAGVDVDFPEVWRAYGPYDSIVQAAGRCNRNGRIDKGVVHIFRPKDDKIPRGIYEAARSQTDLMRRLGLADPTKPESFPAYFRLLYQLTVPDDCEIQRHRGQLHYEEVSKLFHLIEDHTVPVLVLSFVAGSGERQGTDSEPVYANAEKRKFFLRDDWRVFQRNIVNLPRSSVAPLDGGMIGRPPFAQVVELFILTGDAYYQGGLNGCGLEFSPGYEEKVLLS